MLAWSAFLCSSTLHPCLASVHRPMPSALVSLTKLSEPTKYPASKSTYFYVLLTNVYIGYRLPVQECITDQAFDGCFDGIDSGRAIILKLMEVDDPSTCTAILLAKLSDKKVGPFPPLYRPLPH